MLNVSQERPQGSRTARENILMVDCHSANISPAISRSDPYPFQNLPDENEEYGNGRELMPAPSRCRLPRFR